MYELRAGAARRRFLLHGLRGGCPGSAACGRFRHARAKRFGSTGGTAESGVADFVGGARPLKPDFVVLGYLESGRSARGGGAVRYGRFRAVYGFGRIGGGTAVPLCVPFYGRRAGCCGGAVPAAAAVGKAAVPRGLPFARRRDVCAFAAFYRRLLRDRGFLYV